MNKAIQTIESPQAPKPVGPYSQAVIAGDFIFVSGQMAIDPKAGKIHDSTIQGQTRQVIDNIEAILEEVGATLNDVVKVDVFLIDLAHFPEMNAVYEKRFVAKPARTTIQAAALPSKAALVEISCIAFTRSAVNKRLSTN